MAEYNARIRQKRDTSANWTAKDPILLDGEIIIVDTASGSVRKKVGDGTKKYSQLPFDDEEMLTALAEKCDASNAVTATLTAAGWASGQQTLTIAGLGATQNGVIGLSQSITDEQLSAASEAEMYICGQAGYFSDRSAGGQPDRAPRRVRRHGRCKCGQRSQPLRRAEFYRVRG